MSSFPVAAQPGRAMPRVSVGIAALAVVVAVGIGAIVGANALAARATVTGPAVTTAVKHHTATPPVASAATLMATYHGVVSDLAAAEERHDFAAEYRFRTQLDRILTAPMIGTIYQERARLAASLETAAENHDSHNRALISRQLANLCGPEAVKEKLEFCN